MALQNVGEVLWPSVFRGKPTENPGGGYFQSFRIDAAAEQFAICLTAPKAGTIKKAGVFLGTVTVAPINGLDFMLQDIDLTTGDPDGTADDTVTVTAGIASNAFLTGTFPTGKTVAAGDRFAIVIDFTSFVALDSVDFRAIGSGAARSLWMHANHIDHFTTAWTKDINSIPILYIEYSDGSVVPITGIEIIGSTTETLTLTTATTPDEAGLYISALPFKCRCVGIWAMLDLANAAAVDLVLYDASDTILGHFAVAFDEDEGTENGSGGVIAMFSPVTLTAGALYRVAVLPTAALNVALQIVDVTTAGHLNMLSGGSGVHYTARTDAGAWSQTTTRRPVMGLILDQLDDGVSSGGGLRLAGHGGLAA